MADEPRVKIDVVMDVVDGDGVVRKESLANVDLTDEVRGVARDVFRQEQARVETHVVPADAKVIHVHLPEPQNVVVINEDSGLGSILESDEQERASAQARQSARREAAVARARRDAAVEAEIRRSTRPRSTPAPYAGVSKTKGQPWSVEDQQRIKKGLRPLGRRPAPKPEPTPLEKLQRRVGL